MKWLRELFGSKKEQPSDSSTENPMAISDPMIGEINEIVDELDSMASELTEPSSEELVWTEWFDGLPEDHKQFVDLCDASGIKVTAENLDEMLKAYSSDQSK